MLLYSRTKSPLPKGKFMASIAGIFGLAAMSLFIYSAVGLNADFFLYGWLVLLVAWLLRFIAEEPTQQTNQKPSEKNDEES